MRAFSGIAQEQAQSSLLDSQRVTRQNLSSALYLELTCSMLRAGCSLPQCLGYLAELNAGQNRLFLGGVVERLKVGASWEQAWSFMPLPDELAGLKDSLGLLLSTGAPTADLLAVMAQRQRRHSYRQAEKSAAKLGVKLVLPLGLCSLPAFIFLGVLPVLVSMVPTVF